MDRSWYNRAGVERVMGYLHPQQYLNFMRETPEFERMLVNAGIQVIKMWFSVGHAEQMRRFDARRLDPVRQWKLSPTDMASLDRWDDYTEAKEAMFFYTSTGDAPWVVIKSNDKKRARLEAMRVVLAQVDYPSKDEAVVGRPDPLIVGPASTDHETGDLPFKYFPGSDAAATALDLDRRLLRLLRGSRRRLRLRHLCGAALPATPAQQRYADGRRDEEGHRQPEHGQCDGSSLDQPLPAGRAARERKPESASVVAVDAAVMRLSVTVAVSTRPCMVARVAVSDSRSASRWATWASRSTTWLQRRRLVHERSHPGQAGLHRGQRDWTSTMPVVRSSVDADRLSMCPRAPSWSRTVSRLVVGTRTIVEPGEADGALPLLPVPGWGFGSVPL